MIEFLEELSMKQHRDIHRVHDGYGHTAQLVPDSVVELDLHLHVVYDGSHSSLIKALCSSVRAITKAVLEERSRIGKIPLKVTLGNKSDSEK